MLLPSFPWFPTQAFQLQLKPITYPSTSTDKQNHLFLFVQHVLKLFCTPFPYSSCIPELISPPSFQPLLTDPVSDSFMISVAALQALPVGSFRCRAQSRALLFLVSIWHSSWYSPASCLPVQFLSKVTVHRALQKRLWWINLHFFQCSCSCLSCGCDLPAVISNCPSWTVSNVFQIISSITPNHFPLQSVSLEWIRAKEYVFYHPRH